MAAGTSTGAPAAAAVGMGYDDTTRPGGGAQPANPAPSSVEAAGGGAAGRLWATLRLAAARSEAIMPGLTPPAAVAVGPSDGMGCCW